MQSLKALRVTLSVPQGRTESRPIEVTALLAREIDPPDGESPVEWKLLTNLEVTHLDQAEQMLSWYLCRWQVEIFFRILKSGCKIEDLQLEKLERLEPAILLYMLIAWRVLFLTAWSAGNAPSCPAILFSTTMSGRRSTSFPKKNPPPETPPTLNSMIRMIAGFGGFLNRAADGLPGPQTIWIGLQRSKDFMLAIESHRRALDPGCG